MSLNLQKGKATTLNEIMTTSELAIKELDLGVLESPCLKPDSVCGVEIVLHGNFRHLEKKALAKVLKHHHGFDCVDECGEFTEYLIFGDCKPISRKAFNEATRQGIYCITESVFLEKFPIN